MGTFKTKYFKNIEHVNNTKNVNNTIWLDKLINQFKKKRERVLIMNTFRDKLFKMS